MKILFNNYTSYFNLFVYKSEKLYKNDSLLPIIINLFNSIQTENHSIYAQKKKTQKSTS